MYNKTKKYEDDILPLMKRILIYCNEYNIPMFATFAVSDDGKKTTYNTEVVTAASLGLTISEDHLVKHASILSGWDTIPVAQPSEFLDEDDLESLDEIDIFEEFSDEDSV